MTGINNVKPKNKRFKKALAGIILFILGRAFQVISRTDRTVGDEVNQWPEGFKLELAVHPHGPALRMQKINGRLAAKQFGDQTADLSMGFKHIESAMLVLLPLVGVPRAFAERRITVTGDVAKSMSFVRCLNVVLYYLYPDFVADRVVRRRVALEWKKKWPVRCYFYTIGIITG